MKLITTHNHSVNYTPNALRLLRRYRTGLVDYLPVIAKKDMIDKAGCRKDTSGTDYKLAKQRLVDINREIELLESL